MNGLLNMPAIRRWAGRTAALAVCSVAFSACEDVAIPVTLEFERSYAFTFDTSTPTSESETLFRSDIIGDIDIPDDASAPDVALQQFALSLTPGTGNEATSVTVRYNYGVNPLTQDLTLNVAALNSEPVQALIASAVQQLRDDFEAILGDLGSAPNEITVSGEVVSIQPNGARLVLDAELDVLAAVTFTGCLPIGVPGGVVGPEAECENGGT